MEISRSRPFVFRKLGFEICNGMRLEKNGDVYLSWAENDREMFIANCSSENILDFIAANQNKHGISFFQAFFLLKNSFRG
jgi:hypothetical protein